MTKILKRAIPSGCRSAVRSVIRASKLYPLWLEMKGIKSRDFANDQVWEFLEYEVEHSGTDVLYQAVQRLISGANRKRGWERVAERRKEDARERLRAVHGTAKEIELEARLAALEARNSLICKILSLGDFPDPADMEAIFDLYNEASVKRSDFYKRNPEAAKYM